MLDFKGNTPNSQGPLVHDGALQAPGSDGIANVYAKVRPQFSGMSFVSFDYPSGEYSGGTGDFWSIGVVRKPYQNKASHFGHTSSASRTVCAGEVVVIPPGVDYSTKISTPGAIDYLILTCDRFTRALASHHIDDARTPSRREAFFNSQIMSTLLDGLLKLAKQPKIFDAHHADNFINAIVSEYDQTSCKKPDGTLLNTDSRLTARDLRQVEDMIEAKLDGALSNADLSALLNLPEATFLKLFKATTGLTPYQFVLQRRIARARRLLGTTQLSIAQIAFQCGFSSQSHMTDVFRTRVGAPPGVVRKTLC